MTAVVGFLLFVAGFVVRDYLHEREQRATPERARMPGPIVDTESARRWKEWEAAMEQEQQAGIIPPQQSPESVVFYHCTPERLLNMAGLMREVSE